ncbi:MAG: DUF4433 domain-containing protein [Myxococcota bacterium]
MKLTDGTTAAFRVVHLDNLQVYLRRGMLHAASSSPSDGLDWRPTHAAEIQTRRASASVPVGPGGVLLDYVPFHLGPRNLFLYNLNTRRVPGYAEGQEPLVTLVVAMEDLLAAGHRLVFYDGHALNALSACFDSPAALAGFDWEAIDGRDFSNADPDRKRRKQAELLVHQSAPWSLVRGIAVCNDVARTRTLRVMSSYPTSLHKPVRVTPNWYF